MEELIRQIIAIRECGNVERTHTTPHHGSYSNAAHSWHLVVLLIVLHPAPSSQLLLAALFHDVPERWTGDLPGIYKSQIMSTRAKHDLESVEKEILDNLKLLNFLDIDEDDALWLKACDMLEYWLWCQDQLNMGNNHVSDSIHNVNTWFTKNSSIIPQTVRHFKEMYTWRRTSDIDGFKIGVDDENWEEEDWLSRSGN